MRLMMCFQDFLRAQGKAEELCLTDHQRKIFRTAQIRGGRLDAVLFLAPQPQPEVLRWNVVQKAFAAEQLDGMSRKFLLSGRSLDGAVDEGPNQSAPVLACHTIVS